MKRQLAIVFACFTLAAHESWSCSSPLPEPTLRQHFAQVERVYMARLTSLRSTPQKSDYEGVAPGAIENATFEVLLVVKGPRLANQMIKIQTDWWPGNCRLSILRPPIEVIDSKVNAVPNPYSDVWILFLSGKEPFELLSTLPSRPINLFNESDLRFLLHVSQK